MADCSHPVQMHGLCAICGIDLVDNDNVDSPTVIDSPNFHILHTNPHIKVTAEEASRISNENMDRLLREGRLSLVVDLDQTVLHATVDSSVHEWLHDSKHPLHQYTEDIHKVALHDSPHIYYIKLRPGLEHFFLQLSKLFELHVYTMGSRSYAHSVVKLFDPDGRLFNDRILSRDDNEIIENRKKLERIFPTDDRMVLVIDDRSDVWPNCRNLVQVPAYTFFVGTGDINSPTKLLDGETGIQEETRSTVINSNDNVLLTIERVLTTIHQRFFEEFKANGNDEERLPDAKDILSNVKNEVFAGCSFVFSGLLSQNSAFEEQEIWKLSKDFGANCETELNDETTHLISNRIDTEKALESQERGITAVRPEWIYECARKWQRVDLLPFKLEISGKRRKRNYTETEDESNNNNYESFALDEKQIILNEADLEEIQRELADLEDEDEDEDDRSTIGSNSNNSSESNNNDELSDDDEDDFSDLLDYSSSSSSSSS